MRGVSTSASTKLLLMGMAALLVLNYLIFWKVLDRPSQEPPLKRLEDQLRKEVAVELLELQLERKDKQMEEKEKKSLAREQELLKKLAEQPPANNGNIPTHHLILM